MTGASSGERISGRDLISALLAGALPWHDGRSFTAAETLAAGIAASAAGIVGTATLLAATTPSARICAALTWFGLALYLGPEVWAALAGRTFRPGVERSRPFVRFAGFVLATSCAAMIHWTVALAVFVPIGIDAAVTLHTIGVGGGLFENLRLSARSPVQIGFVAGIACGSWFWRPSTPTALVGYAVFVSGVVIATAVSSSMQVWIRQTTIRERSSVGAVRQEDARYFAGWLHDQVSNPVRLLRLRLADGTLERESIVSELDRLETLLRTGQVDHLVESGYARLRDIVQPYLRLAERHGVDVVDVPTHDVANLALTTFQARLASRSFGILVNNALQAGATRISVRGAKHEDFLDLEVEDDAGGFDFDPAHAGRSLTDLREALRGALTFAKTDSGTIARARIALT